MQTVEPVSTREDTERPVKILDSNYTKAYLEQVFANVTQMNDEDRTELLGILNYLRYFLMSL